jgi:L-fuconolactonase
MPLVVDSHLHLFRRVTEQYPRTTFERMADESREERVERLIDAMDAAGVDRAVVVPLSKEDHYLAEVLSEHGDRFAGVGVFDHDRPDDVAAIADRHTSTGFKGLRFFGLQADMSSTPDTIACTPVLEYMARNGLVVWFYGDLVQLRALDLVMERLPELEVVLNHCAFLPDIHTEMQIDEHLRPHFEVQLPPLGLSTVEELAARHPNLHVHFSGLYAFSREPYPYRDLTDVAHRLFAAFGPHRMLMASDWPWVRDEPGYAEVLGLVDVFYPDISAGDRAMIRGGVAAKLFGFD